MTVNEELVYLLGKFSPVTAKRAITKMSQPEWMAANGFTSQEDKQMIELLIKYLYTVASEEVEGYDSKREIYRDINQHDTTAD